VAVGHTMCLNKHGTNQNYNYCEDCLGSNTPQYNASKAGVEPWQPACSKDCKTCLVQRCKHTCRGPAHQHQPAQWHPALCPPRQLLTRYAAQPDRMTGCPECITCCCFGQLTDQALSLLSLSAVLCSPTTMDTGCYILGVKQLVQCLR
jgi:hypothetical protein